MAILGCNFNIIFDQTLAPGSSPCNTLRTELHAWTESSIIVEFMVKFNWQHNLPVGSYHSFKMPPGRLDIWCSKGKKWDPLPSPPHPPVTPELTVREVSQSGFWNILSHSTSSHPNQKSRFYWLYKMNDSGFECITNQCTPYQATCITKYSIRILRVTSQWRSGWIYYMVGTCAFDHVFWC